MKECDCCGEQTDDYQSGEINDDLIIICRSCGEPETWHINEPY